MAASSVTFSTLYAANSYIPLEANFSTAIKDFTFLAPFSSFKIGALSFERFVHSNNLPEFLR
jgi:hypothetical protein